MSCEHACPISVVLDSAEKLVEEVEHQEPAKALGGIAITRRARELVLESIHCTGPVKSQSGQEECSVKDMVYGVRGMSTAPWPPQNFIVDLEKGIKSDQAVSKTDSFGQYI